MTKKIITISREYGSGGRQIGLAVSKRLSMEFYDKELIDAAAKEIGFPSDLIADREQRLTNSLLYHFAMGAIHGMTYPREPKISELPLTEQIFLAQKAAIEEAAKRESCVFIGRCADYILKSRPDVLRVFIYAPREVRKRRAIEEYGDLEDIYESDKHHPYTVGLFGAIPDLDHETDRLKPIDGLMPDPMDLPQGCYFCPRCPHKTALCETTPPPVCEVSEGHTIKCHLFAKEAQ